MRQRERELIFFLRGTMATGENHFMTELTEEEVTKLLEMRQSLERNI